MVLADKDRVLEAIIALVYEGQAGFQGYVKAADVAKRLGLTIKEVQKIAADLHHENKVLLAGIGALTFAITPLGKQYIEGDSSATTSIAQPGDLPPPEVC